MRRISLAIFSVILFVQISSAGRYYDSRTGRFLQVDPRADKGPNLTVYAYSFNNPLKFIDPDGKWPTAVHNRIIERAFGHTLSRSQISNIQFGSQEVDRGQGSKTSYMHAMRAPGETKQDAQSKMNAFIENKELDFITLAQTGNYRDQIKAYISLGEALHPIMDATSPSHNFDIWPGFPLSTIELIVEIDHGRRENVELTDEQIEKFAAQLRLEYEAIQRRIEEERKKKEQSLDKENDRSTSR